MASTESVIGGGGLAGQIQRLAFVAVGANPRAAAKSLDLRAIASVGFASLIGLPLLLIASVALDAPFAAPAAIGCFYLAIAAAHRWERRRSAAAISAVVLIALAIVSPAMMLMQDESTLPAATLAALLLAPFLAAAPALMRALLQQLQGSPGAPVVAASPDEPRQRDGRAENVPLTLNAVVAQSASETKRPTNEKIARFRTDAGEAIVFAMRRLAKTARDNNVTMIDDAAEGAAAAACDRQTLRRIACLVAAHAVAVTPSGGSVRLSARRLRGAVLLRVTCEGESDASMADANAGDLAIARALVDGAGGTLLMERSNERACISVRLDLAPTVANENCESGVRRVAF
jgi:signal transduction histidine kinase